MESIARDVIRALRGPRSQRQLSRRLGYRSNPVAEWEGGRRWPAASVLFRMADLVGVDVDAAVSEFHPGAASAWTGADLPGIAAWLTALKGDQTIRALADRVGHSRSAVSRWLSGDTQLNTPDLLRVVDATTGRLPDFVATLVPISTVPALAEMHAQARLARRLLFDHPWAIAVLAVVQTSGFDADHPATAAGVGAALAIPEDVAGECLSALCAAGVLAPSGEGYLASEGSLVVDTDAVPGGVDALKRHWNQVAVDRLSVRSPDDQFGYAVFSVSRGDLARLRDLHRAYYRQVRAIVAASEPTDTVALLNLHLIELGPRS